ncbi:uncharacterized protein LOC119923159, partial [Tachyglossus aculeatus]|uniref:uncharacterized protein LOC119923159 n=1 Tax=Tachyglossus aculeatus TaxID=9261 RepID=UPI0018F72E80
MNGPSTLIQASWERRRAWLRQGRRRRPRGLEEEEEEDARAGATAELPGRPEEEPPLQDVVFEEGKPALQMEDWLRNCRSSEKGAEEESSLSITDGFYRTATSLEDDLTLGAEGKEQVNHEVLGRREVRIQRGDTERGKKISRARPSPPPDTFCPPELQKPVGRHYWKSGGSGLRGLEIGRKCKLPLGPLDIANCVLIDPVIDEEQGRDRMLLAANGKHFPRGLLARMVQEAMGWVREEEFCEGVKARNDAAEERETVSPPASPRIPELLGPQCN